MKRCGSRRRPERRQQEKVRWVSVAGSAPFDPSLCFVRLRKVRGDGFVEFDFAIGEPELSVELVLPVAAFHEFCRANHVTQIAPIEGVAMTGEQAPDSAPGARARTDT